ncbi:hypothetical protein FB45DRAFT_744919 [Roridomyces roridus]|uniref:Cyclin N-terminal domain-containing protein n=1 Tax=Roridomyces roridus TaxID=1738132 RepID=A0AAD7BXU6_9AGAR|nr:hypothetical protein FB45DRAFT_744919 [Roridomyces roridus]
MRYYSSSPASSSSSSYASWSPASRKSSSPVHAASLVDASRHSPELLQLVDVKLTKPVIGYIVECVSETVDYAMVRSSSRRKQASRSTYVDSFTSFASTLLERAEVKTPTLLVALVYVARARPFLSIALEQWALERVFLGALICASKYTNDATLKNVHWGLCTGVFGKRDVGRIEREFLEVLDWELGVTEADLLAHHEGLVRVAAVPRRPRRLMPVLPSSSYPSPPTTPTRTLYATKPYARTVPIPISAPELSSSPQSSEASLSPRTPMEIDVVIPPRPTRPRRCPGDADVLHDLELLLSFPIPVAVPISQHHRVYGHGGHGRPFYPVHVAV